MKKCLLLLVAISLFNFALGNSLYLDLGRMLGGEVEKGITTLIQNPKVLLDWGASLSFAGEEEGILLITHPMPQYDYDESARNGSNRVLSYAGEHSFKTIVLLDFTDKSGPFKLKFPHHYLSPSLPADFYIHSRGGEHSLSLSNSRVLLAGGQFQNCFFRSLIQYVGSAFQKMAMDQKRPIIFAYLITDAIYGFPSDEPLTMNYGHFSSNNDPFLRWDNWIVTPHSIQTLAQMGSEHFSIDYWNPVVYPYITDVDAYTKFYILTQLRSVNKAIPKLKDPSSYLLSYLELALIISDGDKIEFGHEFTTGKENILVVTYLTSRQLTAEFDFTSHEQNILREVENASNRKVQASK